MQIQYIKSNIIHTLEKSKRKPFSNSYNVDKINKSILNMNKRRNMLKFEKINTFSMKMKSNIFVIIKKIELRRFAYKFEIKT